MCHEGRTEHHLSYGWQDHINLDALVPEFIIVITLIAITRRRNQTYLPDLRASLVKRAAWSSGLPELMIISPSITINPGHPPQHLPHQHHCHRLHFHKLQQHSTCLSRVQGRWGTRWSDRCPPGKWKWRLEKQESEGEKSGKKVKVMLRYAGKWKWKIW